MADLFQVLVVEAAPWSEALAAACWVLVVAGEVFLDT
jgi:hypothetical protein